jgi:tRNA-specific 2-thiouridylase
MVMAAKRVMVAMSGGVDSSVAAAILVQQGYHVEGMTMRLWREGPLLDRGEPNERARSVCRSLGIVHHELDLRATFYDQIVRHWMQEYVRGRTPNPCLRCNRLLKFGTLLRAARDMGCEGLATGHYARISHDEKGWHLLCGMDHSKDQSYFLYSLGQEELSRTLFPLGTWSKAEARAKAQEWGLPVAEQAESQDICFLRDHDYRRFLAENLEGAIRAGPIYDTQNRLLGQHRGLAFYTVGQREGLGIAASRPYYVLLLDSRNNAIIVGHAERLGRTALLAEEMHYVSGRVLPEGYPVEAKIRYRAHRASARVWSASGGRGSDGRARLVFERPLRDIAPGQAVVMYEGMQVLGGGIIAESMDEDSSDVDATDATSRGDDTACFLRPPS